MASVTLIVRVALALVFAVAGAGKLADRAATRDTIVGFGLPPRFARSSAAVLPVAELLAAVGLLVQQSSRWGALLAGLLLLAFITGIGYALRQGRAPECNCFGQLTSAQIGPRTLVRNAILLALALAVAWKAPGSSLSSWTSDTAAANLVAAVAVLACALLLVTAVQFRRLAVSGGRVGTQAPAHATLLPGSVAPAFALPDLSGAQVTLNHLTGRGLPTVLIFASPGCLPCRALMPELSRWNDAMADSITFAVIESGVPEADQPAAHREATGLTTLFEPERELALAYSVGATPTAVLITPEGLIAAPSAGGGGAIESLVRETLRTASQPLAPTMR